MRIISGKYGGMRLNPPGHMPHTRPTTDTAREGIFNILQSATILEGIRTLELFAGTGAVSFELASRGATALTLVEKDPRLAAFLSGEAKRLGIPGIQVLRRDAFSFLRTEQGPYDLIFADPPYQMEMLRELPDLVLIPRWLTPGGWFILEHDRRSGFDDHPCFSRKRNYGNSIFSIFILQ